MIYFEKQNADKCVSFYTFFCILFVQRDTNQGHPIKRAFHEAKFCRNVGRKKNECKEHSKITFINPYSFRIIIC